MVPNGGDVERRALQADRDGHSSYGLLWLVLDMWLASLAQDSLEFASHQIRPSASDNMDNRGVPCGAHSSRLTAIENK